MNRGWADPPVFRWATLLAALFLMAVNPLAAQLPPAASQGAVQGGPAPTEQSIGRLRLFRDRLPIHPGR